MSCINLIIALSVTIAAEVNDSVRSPVILPELVIKAYASDKLESTSMGKETMSQEEIKSVPTLFGEPDVIKAMQFQPGVSAGTEGFAGMYVRGGNSDENLFVVDGNPIYQLNHLGGLFSPFNVEAIRKLEFYKSSFPARYGGRLSSVVDITTRSGDATAHKGSVSVGLLSGNLNIEGPIVKGKSSFNFSLRRSWLELVSVPTLAIINSINKDSGEKTIAGYSFTDINLKLTHWFKPNSILSLQLYYGSDRLKLGTERFQQYEKKDITLSKELNRLKWRNLVVAMNWKHQFKNDLMLETNLSFTRYFSTTKQSVVDYDVSSEGAIEGSDYLSKTVDNGINDIGVDAKLVYTPFENHTFRFGLNYTHHWFTPEKSLIEVASLNRDNSFSKIQANEFSLFLEDDFELTDWLAMNVGLRFPLYESNKKVNVAVEPRLSTNFRVSTQFSIKAGYSRMSQCVQQVSNSYISLPTDFWMPVSDKFKPLRSDQLSVGAYYRLASEYIFSIEGYYKWMNNLLEYREDYAMMPLATTWDEKLTSGNGTAYGLDFSVEKDFGKFTGFVGYGLLWTDRVFPELNNGEDFPSKYDNRHKINIQLNYKINKNIDLNCGWTFMSGNRMTLALENYPDVGDSGFSSSIVPTYPYDSEWDLEYFTSKNNFRLPAYHRLDLGLTIRQPMKNGNLGIWTVGLYNAYCNMNPIVVKKSNMLQNSSGEVLTPKFQTLSIFPIIPSISYTYKF